MSVRGAQALQVFAVAFMRLHDSGALRDEVGKAALFGRLRGGASPNILPLNALVQGYMSKKIELAINRIHKDYE